jgi:ABC-type branched-subunit amino acid transport system ATPase component
VRLFAASITARGYEVIARSSSKRNEPRGRRLVGRPKAATAAACALVGDPEMLFLDERPPVWIAARRQLQDPWSA